MEEVIAKKKSIVLMNAVAFIVMALLLIIIGIFQSLVILVVFASLGAVMLIYGGYKMAVYLRQPAKLIVFKDGVLYFPKGISCAPKQVEDCRISLSTNPLDVKLGGDFGTLTLRANGVFVKLKYVEEVKKARDRLQELASTK